MNHLLAYQNSLWLADGERFARYVHAAISKPCPTAAQVRERHRELMQVAKELPGEAIQGSGVDDMAEVKAEAPRAIRATKGKVGVIPIYGPIEQRMSGALEKAGGTPLDFVSAGLDSLLANDSVGAIVLRFDSPGGNVHGVQELADKIYEARAQKPIYAISDSTMASAAYWLGSAASMVIASPSSDVGSVGVYVLHVDESESMAKEGFRVTQIHAGKNKVEFSPYAPLSDDARAEAQARVDSIYDKFMSTLARNFGISVADVRNNFGGGRVVSAEKALAAGMVHRIMPYQQLMEKLTGSSQAQGARRGTSADVMRLRWEAKRRAMEVV